jgi:hypothetical protein
MGQLTILAGAGPAGAAGSSATPTALQITFSGSNASQNVAFRASLIATGGVLPYTFSISSGSLPPGLSLTTATGLISGTPTTPGTYAFTGMVTDSASTTATVSCSITVTQEALGDFTIGTITAAWDDVRNTGLLISIPVTPPSPMGDVVGGHIYLEIPDVSSNGQFVLGVSTPGSAAPSGQWTPLDIRQIPYLSAQQPWVILIPTDWYNMGVINTALVPNLSIRVYVRSYSAAIDPAPIQAGLAGATPSGLVTIPAQTVLKPNSGVEYEPCINGITAQSGILSAVAIATAGSGQTDGTYILADTGGGDGVNASITVVISGGLATTVTVRTGGTGYNILPPTFVPNFAGGTGPTFTLTLSLTPDNSTGKLISPVAVTADTTNLPNPLPTDFAYELVGIWDNDPAQTQIILTGLQTVNGLVPCGPDNILVPHSVDLQTPTTAQWVTIFARSVKVRPNSVGAPTLGTPGQIFRNTIVPGVTPQARIRIGTGSGVNDLSQSIQSKVGPMLQASPGVWLDGKPLGVTTGYVASSAITNPKVASLAIAAGNMQSASVTLANAALDNLVVLTANMANLATTAAKLASSSVYTAAYQAVSIPTGAYQNLSVGNAAIANLAIGTSNIQNLAVTDAKINDLSVGKLTAGTISVAVSLTAPTITVSGGSFTINIDSTNGVKCTGGGTTTLIQNLSAYSVVNGFVCYNTTGGTGAVLISPGNILLASNVSSGINQVLISSAAFIHLFDGAGSTAVALSAASGLQLFAGNISVSVGNVTVSSGTIFANSTIETNNLFKCSGSSGFSGSKTVSDGSATHTVTITGGIITGWT